MDKISGKPNESGLIFDKRLTRGHALMTVFNWIIEKILQSLSRKHIGNHRRQLAAFSFDLIAHRINLDGVFELDELDTFFQWMNPFKEKFAEGVAVDIGANIGNHSLYFSDYFAKVYSFEPNKRTYQLLAINAGLVDNIVCHNCGISNVAREALLAVSAENIGGSAVCEQATNNIQSISLCTLDSLLGHVDNIKLIKIDVEGHEYQALLGSESIIRKNSPIIVFEQHKWEISNGSSKVIDLLGRFGYARFAVVKKYPKIPNGVPSSIGYLITAIARVLAGASMRVTIQEKFDPEFYSFIVALPEWSFNFSG